MDLFAIRMITSDPQDVWHGGGRGMFHGVKLEHAKMYKSAHQARKARKTLDLMFNPKNMQPLSVDPNDFEIVRFKLELRQILSEIEEK
ncbi:UNVERIFIED_CONTAM: hypothetical protein RF648_21235 [Kocuria sp. CPCC 205274]